MALDYRIIPFEGKSPQIDDSVFLAPTAVLVGDVRLGPGVSVWFGVVLRADNGPILIGRGSNIQDNAVIHVPREGTTVLEEEVTIGHGAVLEGCVIGSRAVIGMRSVVLHGAKVGEQAMIAAGSVVGQGADIPARTLAAGAPAVVRKELSGAALQWVSHTADFYQLLRERYFKEGWGRVPSGL